MGTLYLLIDCVSSCKTECCLVACLGVWLSWSIVGGSFSSDIRVGLDVVSFVWLECDVCLSSASATTKLWLELLRLDE